MSIKGVAFDLEGTVVDVEEAHHKGHFEVAKEIGVNLTLENVFEIIPHFIGGPDEKIAEEIWNLSDKKYPQSFVAERDKHYYHVFLKDLPIKPRPGFIDFLNKMLESGIKISIGSLTEKVEAEVLLERSGLNKIFSRELTVLREDVDRLKPAPDVFLETARRMGISAGEQLVFEDSPNGVKAAVLAGSVAIGMPVYNRASVIERLFKEGAKEVYDNWEKVDINKFLTL